MSSEAPLATRGLAQVTAFARLHRGGARRVPLVTQATMSDCGAACLAMVLAYHGRTISLETVRAAVGGGTRGVSARQLVEGARSFALRARGVKIEVDQLRYLPAGSILHWEMNHFVVLESVNSRGARIVDPGSGPRGVSFADLADRCTGIALVIEPTPEFKTTQGRRERASRWTRYRRWLHAAPGYWPRVLALSAVLQVVALSLPAALGMIVDKIVPRQDGHLLQLLAAGVLIVLSVQILTNYVRASLLLHLRTYMDAQMTVDLHDHVLGLPFAFFQQRAVGDLVMRLASGTQIREVLTASALSLILDGSMALIYFALLLALAPTLAWIALAIAVVQALIIGLSGRRNAELMSEQLATQARLSSAQVEALAAIEPIKAMGAERRIAARWADLYVDVLNSALDRGRLSNRVNTVTGALGFAGPVALLFTGAQLVLNGSLGTGAMLSLSSLGSAFLGPVGALVAVGSQLQTLRSYLERLEDLLDAPAERRPTSPESRPRLQGNIALQDVCFAYDASSPTVIDRVNLLVEPGEFLAIVGPSGSGKSTLARLFGGLYTPTSGKISFEGIDAKRWDPIALRGMLGMVTQDTRLLAATVRDNICLFDASIALERVEQAARVAQIHDDIMRLPLGYDTVLSDGGGSLSGGQRQRLALARALLSVPSVMVLDEATSQLDTITERVLHQRLAAMRCTRIMIAHRLSTIREADRIVVLAAGRIIAIGRHRELMVRCRLYRDLVGSQPAEVSNIALPESLG